MYTSRFVGSEFNSCCTLILAAKLGEEKPAILVDCINHAQGALPDYPEELSNLRYRLVGPTLQFQRLLLFLH